MATTPSTIVKIGIQLHCDGEKSLLKEFDLKNTVDSFIEDVCISWKLTNHSDYVLRFTEDIQRNYVAEHNKNEIKHGLLLILDLHPQLSTKLILSSLKLNNEIKNNALQELIQVSKYKDFAQEFINEKGLSLIIFIIETKRFTPSTLEFGLISFVNLMEHNFVSWKIMDHSFVGQIVNFLSDELYYYYPLIISTSLIILKNYIVHSNDRSGVIQKDVLVTSLIMRIGSSIGTNELLKQKIISFINLLFQHSDMADRKIIGTTLLSKDVRSIIWLIMSQAENLSSDLANDLHTLQTNCLNLIQHRTTKIDYQSQYVRVLMRELSRIVAECEEQTQSQTTNTPSLSTTNKMGLKSDLNLISNLNKGNSPGLLALDCMVYFARNYPELYTSIILENNCICETYQCSFEKSSIELVSILCDLLKTMPTVRRYYPMFFNHSHPFEEFFCICIMLYNKTWKEMKATSEDYTIVLGVVREKIIQALTKYSLSFEEFRHGLKTLTYTDISDLWHNKRTDREECKSGAKPVVQLKEVIKPHIMDLIKQHRLEVLVRGKRFPKLNSKGLIIKNSFWFIRLSPNYTFLQYGDCTEKSMPRMDELESVVPVSNIKSLTLRKKSSSTKDKKNNLFSFSIKIISKDTDVNLDFVTQERDIFDHWTDGLNALLKIEMSSKACKEEFNTLMSMEIRLRLLDIEGINIPADPPPIPPLPSDYNFPTL